STKWRSMSDMRGTRVTIYNALSGLTTNYYSLRTQGFALGYRISAFQAEVSHVNRCHGSRV
ncbi:MAG: hypothetical protein K8T25_09175, partial [Planctomycetia bacterium]|nr:hypothetical protein [Planctomycetia bacterium]